jgi:hypothetical protein
MLDTLWSSNDSIELFTDSAGGRNKGFGIYFQEKWAQSCWPKQWVENGTLKDIKFLELFPVVVFILSRCTVITKTATPLCLLASFATPEFCDEV